MELSRDLLHPTDRANLKEAKCVSREPPGLEPGTKGL